MVIKVSIKPPIIFCSGSILILFSSVTHYREVYKKRYLGFIQIFKDVGKKIREDSIFETNFKASGGRNAVEEINNKKKKPTAIVAANVIKASDTLRIVKSEGIRTLEGIKVIGFDNIQLTALTVLCFSTVIQPIEDRKDPDRSPDGFYWKLH